MPEIDVVLHPQRATGVEAALRATPGVRLHQPADDAGVVAALDAGASVLVTFVWREAYLRPSLKWIAGMGAGYEQYPLDRLAAQGTVLTSAHGVHADCVAEHAFALLLALTRRIGESMRHATQAHWKALPGEELAGKKLAIVGLGLIGEAFARRTQGWDMETVGIKRRPADYRGVVADVRDASCLAEVCAWADIVLLCAPASADRRPLIGAAELEALGAGWLVNVGRGTLVDEAALLHALNHGRLRGAGLDVTAVEPLPAESPLWAHPKVVLSAHNAGASPGYGPRWGAVFAHNLAAFQGSGAGWRNRIEA